MSDVKTDKQGRILDQSTGQPLRDRRSRNFGKAPFKGEEGKVDRKATARLARRQSWFDSERDKDGTPKGSGVAAPHDFHRPGSMSK